MTTIRTQSGIEYGDLENWLDDVIADTGGFENFTRDEDGTWVMPDDEAEWWVDYEAREIRINDAMEEADEDVRERVACECQYSDLETNQRIACSILGIDY